MAPKIKNLIIYFAVAVFLILGYFLLVKKPPEEKGLVSNLPGAENPASGAAVDTSITKDFLSVLLNVKDIKMDDSVFSARAFMNLKDSSILLIPTGDEGRLNPFAPIGAD